MMVINAKNKDKSLNTTINACFLCHKHSILQIHRYNSQRKAKVRRTGTRSPTKANTDHHNGDLKNTSFNLFGQETV